MHNIWFSEELRENLDNTFSKKELSNYFSKIYSPQEVNKMFGLGFYSFIGKDYSVMGYPSMDKRMELLRNYGSVDSVNKKINNYHSHMLQKYAGMSDPEDYNTLSIPAREGALHEIFPEIKKSINNGRRVNPKSIDKVFDSEMSYAGVVLGPRLIEVPGGSVGGYHQ